MIFNESQTDIPFQAMQALLLNSINCFLSIKNSIKLKKKIQSYS